MTNNQMAIILSIVLSQSLMLLVFIDGVWNLLIKVYGEVLTNQEILKQVKEKLDIKDEEKVC